jgi:hypothetical protein
LLNIDLVLSSETPNVKMQIQNRFHINGLKQIRAQCAIQIGVWPQVSAVGYDTRLRMPGNQENSPGTPGGKSGRNLADDLVTNYPDNLHPDALIF